MFIDTAFFLSLERARTSACLWGCPLFVDLQQRFRGTVWPSQCKGDRKGGPGTHSQLCLCDGIRSPHGLQSFSTRFYFIIIIFLIQQIPFPHLMSLPSSYMRDSESKDIAAELRTQLHIA